MENRKDELFQVFHEEMTIIKTRVMLNKLISINLTLFHEIRNYAYANNIPLRFSPTILRLVDEIEKTDTELIRRKVTGRKSDGEVTEPQCQFSMCLRNA